ncbi:MAG: hypothetical protein LBL01_04215, partial [Bifidobacteriaceae bacterium]|nr:hypothetical protein [Bifidobacteriaceae bacterium]
PADGASARGALVIRQGRAHPLAADPRIPRLEPGALGAYVYEPDGAVIRASLIEQAADAAGLADARLLHPRIAYVTSDVKAVGSPFLTGWEVVEAFPFSLKRLRGWVRERGIGRMTVKKRGTAVEPADLLKRLELKGEGTAVVILTRLGARQSVLVVRPLQDF